MCVCVCVCVRVRVRVCVCFGGAARAGASSCAWLLLRCWPLILQGLDLLHCGWPRAKRWRFYFGSGEGEESPPALPVPQFAKDFGEDFFEASASAQAVDVLYSCAAAYRAGHAHITSSPAFPA